MASDRTHPAGKHPASPRTPARITINEVARVAGVSKATVSRVINSRPVSEESRRRVVEAIRRLDFQPNAQARGLPLGRSRMVGVIIPVIANLFFARIIHGIEEVLSEQGYAMVLMSTNHEPDRELALVRAVTQRRVDGVLLITPRQTDDRTLDQYIVQSGSHLVLIDAESHSGDVSSVVVDNRSGGRMATQHLLDLGHRRIAAITGRPDAPETQERLEGYRAALAEARVPSRPEWIATGDYSPESGAAAAERLLALPPDLRPTAIFAFNDLMAEAVLSVLEEKGVRVPGDISVVGYDDLVVASLSRPRLTSVHQPLEQLGRIGARKLLKVISGEEPEPLRIVLPVQLVIRESSGPPPIES